MGGTVNIHGREYKTVALRVQEFRKDHPDWGITTELVESGEAVVMKASVIDYNKVVIGTGYAEEVRGSSRINETSALENCETSAIGRALSACGYAGEEYASANEVQGAIAQQSLNEEYKAMANHTQTLLNCWESVSRIKEGISAGREAQEYKLAAEAWFELTSEEKEALWRAPSKGGCFTTDERKEISSSEFRIAYYGNENYLGDD